MTTTKDSGWRLALPEHAVITLDGSYHGLDPDVAEDRPVGRVVLAMPDFVADSLAHAVAKYYHVAHVMSDGRGSMAVGPLERAVAEGLAAAARACGYQCPFGAGLGLPEDDPGSHEASVEPAAPSAGVLTDRPAPRPVQDRAYLNGFGLRVRVARTARRWSQDQFARRARLDRTYVSRLERGRHAASILILARLARALGVPPAELLP
jgi:DNA-binding XRE family transcriptional regulator